MYTEKDLIKFGEYLLSKEREYKIRSVEQDVPYNERKRMVHDADLQNWKATHMIEFDPPSRIL